MSGGLEPGPIGVETRRPRGPRRYRWRFPLPRPHTGLPLGNGTVGLLLWGGPETLYLTLGRAGFWDRRGGNAFTTRADFAAVRRLLEAGDEAGIRALFGGGNRHGSRRPQQYGGGRLELSLPGTGRLEAAVLDPTRGRAWVEWSGGSRLELELAVDDEVAWLTLPAGAPAEVVLRPAWEAIGPALAAAGVSPPERWNDPDQRGGGMLQTLPEDPPLALAWRREGDEIRLASALGPEAREEVGRRLARFRSAPARRRTSRWWRQYQAEVPELEIPDPGLQRSWDLGLHRQAGLTPPHGVAATLQGAWMEDTRVPPWSNDYHFNINVQMVYGPSLPTGRADHLQPLWDLVTGWVPAMRAMARQFFGADEALMLPHAVDDRCQVVGTFWTGSIDHACTAWTALLAWEHFRFTGDRGQLGRLGWPLLVGAFEGFWAMHEERPGPDGERVLSLPVTVSPEYRGAAINAWGRDSSFQLAAWQAVARALPEAAAALGRASDPRWDDVRRHLPPYTTVASGTRSRIALWAGQDLEESHRHHSHLAAIWPFQTIDPEDPAHAEIVRHSLWHWTELGAGQWTGWCLPWAAILCARVGLVDAALGWLQWWQHLFVNEGGGTLHDADFAGNGGLHGEGAWDPDWKAGPGAIRAEMLQLDAQMGVLTALLELFVQSRPDGVRILPRLPKPWREARVARVRVAGGFAVSARWMAGRVAEVRIEARREGRLRLDPGFAADPAARWLVRDLAAGEVWDLAPPTTG